MPPVGPAMATATSACEGRGISLSELVNSLFRKDIELIKVGRSSPLAWRAGRDAAQTAARYS
jgi:predicted methyltransferase